ncbi:MAG TPA: dihydroorotase, partial [Flavisolibacter sp.]
MDIVLKGVTVIDPSSPFHQQTTDLFIQNGIIAEAGSTGSKADQTIELEGLHISPAFADTFAHFCDPGLEARETLESGSYAAAYGGYADVCVLPNTLPVVDQKSGVEYLVQRSRTLPVQLHPIGAVTRNTDGKELSEMYDMHQSGAVAFSDGLCTIQSSGILLKALQYLKAIDKVLIQLPDDKSISTHGLMNEGIMSTTLGLPGKPAIAEELMIAREIELAKYTDGAIHITGVSTAKGIHLIRQAKKEGINISCSVTPYHLFFSDQDLAQYDTNLKLSPPLRLKEDRAGLQEAVLDGTVDCIASHHLPQHTDHKVVEFEYAKNGMIGLETCFATVRTALPQLSLERLIDLLAINPRKLFGLPARSIRLN